MCFVSLYCPFNPTFQSWCETSEVMRPHMLSSQAVVSPYLHDVLSYIEPPLQKRKQDGCRHDWRKANYIKDELFEQTPYRSMTCIVCACGSTVFADNIWYLANTTCLILLFSDWMRWGLNSLKGRKTTAAHGATGCRGGCAKVILAVPDWVEQAP